MVRFILFLLLAAAPNAQAQQFQPAIPGRVVAADSDAPLPWARLVVTSERQRIELFADAEGRFALTGLERKPATLVASKTGYASTSLEIASSRASRAPREVLLKLERSASISGRVAERNGATAIAVPVVARRINADSRANSSIEFSTSTDDFGEYRLGGLPAGAYIVASGGPLRSAAGANLIATLALPNDSPDRVRRSAFVQSGAGVLLEAAPATMSRQGPGLRVDVKVGTDLTGLDFVVDPVLIPDLPVAGESAVGRRGVIRGRVLASNGEPIAGVLLQLGGVSWRAVNTDARGRYSIDGLSPGTYTLEARKTGYLTQQYGDTQSSRRQPAIVLRRDETIDAFDIVLPRGGVVTGVVLNEHGDAVRGVNVRALQLRYASGRTVASPVGLERQTDDRGRYRLFGLPSGTYVVAARDQATDRLDRTGPQSSFYSPGTWSIDGAARLVVDENAEASGVDLVLTRARGARVAGIALNANGQPLTGVVLLGVSHRSGGIAAEPRQAAIAANGTFTLPDVPPGDYVIQALGARGPGREPEFGSQYVAIGADDPPSITIRTSPGTTLEGRIVTDNQQSRFNSIAVTAVPMDLDRFPLIGRSFTSFTISSSGTFYLTGLYGLTKLTLATTLEDWYVKSFSVGGFDATYSGFDFGLAAQTVTDAELEIARARAGVIGRVVDESSTPVNNAWVIVFSADREKWLSDSRHVRSARVSGDGSFSIDGLPPGDYWIAAVDRLEDVDGSGDWRNPGALESLSTGARRLTLADADRQTSIVRLVRR